MVPTRHRKTAFDGVPAPRQAGVRLRRRAVRSSPSFSAPLLRSSHACPSFIALVIGVLLLLVARPVAADTDWCQTKPAAGQHTLPPPPTVGVGATTPCALGAEITVVQGTELRLETTIVEAALPSRPAVISGMGVTRLFHVVGGSLVLAHLILEVGRSNMGATIFVENAGALRVEGGRMVAIRDSRALVDGADGFGGGGVALVSSGTGTNTLTVTGASTTFLLERNIATAGGALYVLSTGGGGNTVVVEQGATLTLKNNSATVGTGGGASLSGAGTNVTLAGEASQVIIESNTAESRGGGVYAEAKARVSVESGATFIVENNSATSVTLGFGGGLYLRDEGTALTTSGNGTTTMISGNTAEISGAGLLSVLGADVLVSSGANMVVTMNEAVRQSGGGVYLVVEGSTLTVTGAATKVMVSGNKAGQAGAGLVSANGADVAVENGAKLAVNGNEATGLQAFGGGVIVQDVGSSLTVSGNGTQLWVENNTAGLRGGGWASLRGAAVLLSEGAVTIVGNNKAVSEHGGGIFIASSSSFTATGYGTQLKIESNTAGRSGGGCYSKSGAAMLFDRGAMVAVKNNEAVSEYGGGLYLADVGSSLNVSGNGTQLTIESNTAESRGGGLSSFGATVLFNGGAVVVVKNNKAVSWHGGGVYLDAGSSLTATGQGRRQGR